MPAFLHASTPACMLSSIYHDTSYWPASRKRKRLTLRHEKAYTGLYRPILGPPCPYKQAYRGQSGQEKHESTPDNQKRLLTDSGSNPRRSCAICTKGNFRAPKIGREYRIPERSLNSLLAPADIRPSPNGTRQARITAIVNQKGGVGKTTTTFNLGVALQRRGRQVLLVDLDPQASLSVSAGINIGQLKKSVYQLLLDPDLDPHEVVFTTQTGVSILPSTIDLAAAEVELVTMTLRELVLKDALDQLQGDFDHILIDCPPSLGLLTINASQRLTKSSFRSSASFWRHEDWPSCLEHWIRCRAGSIEISRLPESCRPCSTYARSTQTKS